MQISHSEGWNVIERVLDDHQIHNHISIADLILDSMLDEGLMVVKSNEKKLNPAQVRAIRSKHRLGDSQAELAKFYGVNPATISRIVRGIYH